MAHRNHASSGLEQLGELRPAHNLTASKNVVITLKKCRHPKEKLETDPATNATWCHECGLEMPRKVSLVPVSSEKFERSPTNAAVFGNNLRTTTKRKGENGPEHHHLEAVSAVYGNNNGSKIPLERLTETCPSCGEQQILRVFGETVRCGNEDCGIELGHYVLRWLPFIHRNGNKNGNGTTAIHARFSADLRLLQFWDPPEADPIVKLARDLFRKKVFGHMGPEEAHFLAKRFLRGVKELSKVYRKDVKNLLDGLLEGEGIIIR